ncbi:MAG: hypothetical protein ABR516_01450 [Desulfuromonadaceae bacterium]
MAKNSQPVADKLNHKPDSGGQLQISAEVARLISADAGGEEKRRALAGYLPLSMHDQIILWYLFYTCSEEEHVRELCLEGVAQSSVMALKPVLHDANLDLRVLEFILLARRSDLPTLIILRPNRSIPEAVWKGVFSTCSYEVLSFFFDSKSPFTLSHVELKAAAANAQATSEIHKIIATRLETGGSLPEADPQDEQNSEAEKADTQIAEEKSDVEQEFDPDNDAEEMADGLDGVTRYQMIQELRVGDKIKLALSGDKEWRSLLLKDGNKQVSGAVLKNPRITEKEVLILCQNRSSNEELIRIILLNREWMKNYSIRLALTMHPRTPLNQAIRFLSTLSEKDLRKLSKSRNISSALVNASRRILLAKSKR